MRIFAVSLTMLLAVGFADAAEPKGYKLIKTVPVPGDGGDKYTLVETIKTKSGAKTMALDPKTHHLFLPAVDDVAATGGGRRTMVPKSFAVLIYEK